MLPLQVSIAPCGDPQQVQSVRAAPDALSQTALSQLSNRRTGGIQQQQFNTVKHVRSGRLRSEPHPAAALPAAMPAQVAAGIGASALERSVATQQLRRRALEAEDNLGFGNGDGGLLQPLSLAAPPPSWLPDLPEDAGSSRRRCRIPPVTGLHDALHSPANRNEPQACSAAVWQLAALVVGSCSNG